MARSALYAHAAAETTAAGIAGIRSAQNPCGTSLPCSRLWSKSQCMVAGLYVQGQSMPLRPLPPPQMVLRLAQSAKQQVTNRRCRLQ